jgi:biopolymer transport protein ExbB/TolQ
MQNVTLETSMTSVSDDIDLLVDFTNFMKDGGPFMWVILFMWILGLLISMERWIKFWVYDVDADGLMIFIKRRVLLNKVKEGIEYCGRGKAVVARVLKSGLQRANQNKDQIKDAMETTILSVLPKMEKRMNVLALMANVSTLLGLLGTIYGLIQSFAAVAEAEASVKAQLLASGISKAMNTTAMGLLCAISLMILHSFLQGKQNKIISDIERTSLGLLDLLGTKKKRETCREREKGVLHEKN